MALKALLETLDGVADAHRDLYKEEGGKFVLDVDGIDDHPKVRGVITANRENVKKRDAFKAEVDVLKAKVAELPEDFTAEEWLRLKAEADDPTDPEKKKKANDEHLQSQKRLYDQRITNLEKKHAEELIKKDQELSERDQFIDSVLVEDGLTKALVTHGVAKEFLNGSRALLKGSVKVVRDDNGSRRAVVETDLGETDVGKFVENWAQSDEGKAYVLKPTGGDALGSTGRASSKSMTRANFDKLDPMARSKAVSDGVKITD